VSLLFIILLAATGNLGYMPKIEDLENPKINLATQIILPMVKCWAAFTLKIKIVLTSI
jgi:hypothetical protein